VSCAPRLLLLICLTIGTGFPAAQAEQPDAQVIIIGAGIAGLAAALEARSSGASVLIVDMNSVGGGHAVMAAGFSLIGTPLQSRRGISDSAQRAAADMAAWAEDGDTWWIQHYAERSGTEVHDWLAELGVNFTLLLPMAEDSVPRFHMSRGGATAAVLPMLRAAISDPGVSFRWHSQALSLQRLDENWQLRLQNLRSGQLTEVLAPTVIIATGGFQSNEELVRSHWPEDIPQPAKLYLGAGEFATGSGLALARSAGAKLVRMDRQLIYVSAIPDPRAEALPKALLVQNPAAIIVNEQGRRFTNEAAPGKLLRAAVLAARPKSYWLLFDQSGREQLAIRGAAWLSDETIAKEIIDNPVLTRRADSISGLANAAGLPPANLRQSVTAYNSMLAGHDQDEFGRSADAAAVPLATPPYFALQLVPMTRISMGGIAVDRSTRVLDSDDRPIAGLYAAGEVSGVAGLNGSHGASGTFLGPALLMGRMAGSHAAALTGPHPEVPLGNKDSGQVVAADPADLPSLPELIAEQRPGYWHFAQVHRLVLERESACDSCHSPQWPAAPASSRTQQLSQLASCSSCH